MFLEWLVGICMLIVVVAAMIGFEFPKLSVICADIIIVSGCISIVGCLICAFIEVFMQ